MSLTVQDEPNPSPPEPDQGEVEADRRLLEALHAAELYIARNFRIQTGWEAVLDQIRDARGFHQQVRFLSRSTTVGGSSRSCLPVSENDTQTGAASE